MAPGQAESPIVIITPSVVLFLSLLIVLPQLRQYCLLVIRFPAVFLARDLGGCRSRLAAAAAAAVAAERDQCSLPSSCTRKQRSYQATGSLRVPGSRASGSHRLRLFLRAYARVRPPLPGERL